MEVKIVAIKHLHPDFKNPRIPESCSFESEEELMLFVADTYDSITVARSISKHGFFASEPLIAVADKKKKGEFIVIEGNRRLAALQLLLDSDLRSKVIDDNEEWEDLSTKEIPEEIPVLEVSERKSVAPIIGYRHISGIEPWDPYAKARYIAMQIDDYKLDFKEVASEVGEKENEVRAIYRNYRVAKEIGDFGIDTEGLKDKFGVFTRAMQSDIRNFINVPAPSEIEKGKDLIPKNKKANAKELVELMFGPDAVLKDSRDLSKLGKVLSSEDGLEELRKSKDLEEAFVASGGLLERLRNHLIRASSELKAARLDINTHREDEDVKRLLSECKDRLNELNNGQ